MKKNYRKLKVYEKYNGTSNYAQIVLMGRWVEHAGFPIGQEIYVKVESNKITITLNKPEV